MEFEWDEVKRRANILKHRIDFVDAIGVYEGRFVQEEDRRRNYGERRYLITGIAAGQVLRLVCTWRGERCRIISARRASRDERRAYHASDPEAGSQNEG
jgi:uncharacterized DUF497 family protein